jgi:hypothetical protein
MHYFIDNAERPFTLLREFRQTHALPDTFGVALFEPKDFAGLAAIDQAGQEMIGLRQGILDLLPPSIKKLDLLDIVDGLQAAFRAGLYSINSKIGLKTEEAEFAVAGFGDMLRDWVYVLFAGEGDFKTVYYKWLNDSIRVSQTVHEYPHEGQVWRVNILNHAYGRMGLKVQIGEDVYYLADGVYSCPAEGYMLALLSEICAGIQERLSAK